MASRFTTKVISPTSSRASIKAPPIAALAASITPSSDAVWGTWAASMLPLYGPFAADLPLQLQDPVEQRLRGRRAARHVDVDRDDAVAAADHRITIMVIAAAVCAAAHRDHVARLGHLVINAAQGRRHLVAQRSGDDHHVGLARAGTGGDAEALEVIARH